MKGAITTTILFLAFCLTGFSQSEESGFDNEELKGVVYSKEFTVDMRIHTNGYFALALNKAKIKTYYKTNFYQLEVGVLKHPKESRNNERFISFQNNPAGAYSLGKQNSFFQIRGGMGQKRYFSEKQGEGGLAIGISYMGGITAGFVKPYYLDLVVERDDELLFVSTGYNDEYAAEFLSIGNIINSSGFAKGWKGLSVIPGAHAKIGVHLDWGAYDEFVKAIEFGFMLDVYYKKVPIMISERNKMAFLNVYFAIQLGKRSN
jgi:hypothetical protein